MMHTVNIVTSGEKKMHSLNQLKELKSFYPRIIKDHRWGRAIEYDGYDLDIMEILLEL